MRPLSFPRARSLGVDTNLDFDISFTVAAVVVVVVAAAQVENYPSSRAPATERLYRFLHSVYRV